MPVALLLTLDPGLERELDELWPGDVLLTLDSEEAVRRAVETLEDDGVLLVDTSCFPPPEVPGFLPICISGDPAAGLPFLERPLRRQELLSWISFLEHGPARKASGGPSPILPSPFAEFQRDTVHDLNNQLTTLQGNLILLQEENNDPALEDMAVAAQHAIRLLQWMEWLGAGEFPAAHFHVPEFLTQLLPLFDRLKNRHTEFTLQSTSPEIFLTLDPQKFLSLLLVLTHAVPGPPRNCSFALDQTGNSVRLNCSWTGQTSLPELPGSVERWTQALRATLDQGPGSWTLMFS